MTSSPDQAARVWPAWPSTDGDFQAARAAEESQEFAGRLFAVEARDAVDALHAEFDGDLPPDRLGNQRRVDVRYQVAERIGPHDVATDFAAGDDGPVRRQRIRSQSRGGPKSASSMPRLKWAATGAKRSRPWNVWETSARQNRRSANRTARRSGKCCRPR